MENKDTEREILQKAMEKRQKTAKLNVQVQDGNYDFDTILRIRVHEMELDFVAEVKNSVTPATLGLIAANYTNSHKKGFLLPGT